MGKYLAFSVATSEALPPLWPARSDSLSPILPWTAERRMLARFRPPGPDSCLLCPGCSVRSTSTHSRMQMQTDRQPACADLSVARSRSVATGRTAVHSIDAPTSQPGPGLAVAGPPSPSMALRMHLRDCVRARPAASAVPVAGG